MTRALPFFSDKSWSRTQDKATQLSQEQDELEKQLNELRHLLYDGHAAELKHLEPIDLDEDGNVIAPINPVKVLTVPQNKNLMKAIIDQTHFSLSLMLLSIKISTPINNYFRLQKE